MIAVAIRSLDNGLVSLLQPLARRYQPSTLVRARGPCGERVATAYILRIESDDALLVSDTFNGEPRSPVAWARGDVLLFDETESP